MSNLAIETGLLEPLGKVAGRLASERLSPPTLWRWSMRGVRGVVLETVTVGRKWLTTEAAFREFIRKRYETPTEDVDDFQIRSDTMRQRLIEAGLL